MPRVQQHLDTCSDKQGTLVKSGGKWWKALGKSTTKYYKVPQGTTYYHIRVKAAFPGIDDSFGHLSQCLNVISPSIIVIVIVIIILILSIMLRAEALKSLQSLQSLQSLLYPLNLVLGLDFR